MPNAATLKKKLVAGALDRQLSALYGAKTSVAMLRCKKLVDTYVSTYGDSEDLQIFSAPGRTEIGGNHTDHQNGRVLAAAVNLDLIAVVAPTKNKAIHLHSEGHKENVVKLNDLGVVEEEVGTSNSLIRGILAGFVKQKRPIGAFNAVTVTDVYSGSGLSSSAAFEVMVGVILDNLFGLGDMPMTEIARIGQFAENNYFGKPSGLMDQTACAVGGLITIDFKKRGAPLVEPVEYDFAESGHLLCITGPIGSHADLTAHYAAIPNEMRQVAEFFGRNYLRELDPEHFYDSIPKLYKAVPARAILRAMHFFGDNDRVEKQVAALREGHFDKFLALVNESGRSSSLYLQNVHTDSEQGLSLALALSERLLEKEGATRVHGGGFAGTIQAFVPKDKVSYYTEGMNAVFGANACIPLSIRRIGGTRIV